MLFQPGNTKLGSKIHCWSIPAGKTCPGQTKLCANCCYAKRGHFFGTNVADAHARNLKVTELPYFAAYAIGEIYRHNIEILRIHVGGDFHVASYVRSWLDIVRHCPQTKFYTYTRSWRIPELRPALQKLARERNVHLWLSADRETGQPPVWPGARIAWMAMDDNDHPSYPVDLVFRVQRDTVMKKDVHGNRVCRYDWGQGTVTCSNCKWCFSKSKRRIHVTNQV